MSLPTPLHYLDAQRRSPPDPSSESFVEYAAEDPGEAVLWTIVVSGIPKPQPRGRSSGFKRGDGGVGSRIYDPGSADAWKAIVYQEAIKLRPPEPLEGPLRVDVDWYLPRPKTRLRKKDHDGPIWCAKKVDRDNLDKAVLDALTMVGFWVDDSQARTGTPRVMEHRKGGRPGAVIRIRRAEPYPVPDQIQP